MQVTQLNVVILVKNGTASLAAKMISQADSPIEAAAIMSNITDLLTGAEHRELCFAIRAEANQS